MIESLFQCRDRQSYKMLSAEDKVDLDGIHSKQDFLHRFCFENDIRLMSDFPQISSRTSYDVGFTLRAKQSQLLMAPGLMSPFMTPLTKEIFRPMTCQYLEMNRQHVFIKNRNYLEVLGKKAKTLEIAQMPVE
ncbi:hypothetical protein GQX74_007908 [Glossina fuscipes]|nr:hypothetical protein GQX74_007908 [Glossina fuscipes]